MQLYHDVYCHPQNDSCTALMIASQEGHSIVVQLLIDAGAPLNVQAVVSVCAEVQFRMRLQFCAQVHSEWSMDLF